MASDYKVGDPVWILCEMTSVGHVCKPATYGGAIADRNMRPIADRPHLVIFNGGVVRLSESEIESRDVSQPRTGATS